jgi:hypothetical protein
MLSSSEMTGAFKIAEKSCCELSPVSIGLDIMMDERAYDTVSYGYMKVENPAVSDGAVQLLVELNDGQ